MSKPIIEEDLYYKIVLENAVAVGNDNIPLPSTIQRTMKRIKLSDTTPRLRVQYTMRLNSKGNSVLVDPNDVSVTFNMDPKSRFLVKEFYSPSPNKCSGYYYPTFISATEYNFIRIDQGTFYLQNKADLSYLQILDNTDLFLGFGKPNDSTNALKIFNSFLESRDQTVPNVVSLLPDFINPGEALADTVTGITYAESLGLQGPNPQFIDPFEDYSKLNPFSPDQLLLK